MAGTDHQEIRFGDWKCGNKPCRYPNHAYRIACHKCDAPKSMAKLELPQDLRATACRCGAAILQNFTGACRVCRSPILPPE